MIYITQKQTQDILIDNYCRIHSSVSGNLYILQNLIVTVYADIYGDIFISRHSSLTNYGIIHGNIFSSPTALFNNYGGFYGKFSRTSSNSLSHLSNFSNDKINYLSF